MLDNCELNTDSSCVGVKGASQTSGMTVHSVSAVTLQYWAWAGDEQPTSVSCARGPCRGVKSSLPPAAGLGRRQGLLQEQCAF